MAEIVGDYVPPQKQYPISKEAEEGIGESEAETEERTKRVLILIKDTGFKVNLEKAQWVKQKVKYLGITLEGRG